MQSALRNTLLKGDATDPAFRQRVYRAAMDAFERAMASEPDPQRRSDQKQRLTAAIRDMEASYRRPPSAPEPVRAPQAEVAPPVSLGARRNGAAPRMRPEPELRAEPQLRAEPRARTAPPPDDFPAIGRDDRAVAAPRRRAPFAMMFSIVVLLALAAAGGWWVYSTGAFQSTEERDTSVPNPPLELQNENFDGSRGKADAAPSSGPARIAAAGADDGNWVTLFKPSDPTTLTLVGDASAAIDGDPFGEFARIVSPNSESAIGVDIPPGTLESLAGKTAQFSLIARADDDQETQMSVTCDLAEYGNCGRLRFDVIASDNEFLFSVDLPQGVRISGPGRLMIVTDISNAGKAVKLSNVRVRELER
ncbi:MAG: hypothetical protein CL534_05910 [Ahrensia sp.]|nr:hypothetical protein [Ahrensia sp.]